MADVQLAIGNDQLCFNIEHGTLNIYKIWQYVLKKARG